MMYSKKKKLDRRNSIMAGVRKELKANNVFVRSDLLVQLAKALDTKLYYEVKLVSDITEVSKALRLKDMVTQTSMGSRGVQEKGTIAFGSATFGTEYGTADDVTRRSDGEFDLNEAFGAIIRVHDWRMWDGDDYGNYDEESGVIIIYSPEKIYDEANYEAEKDIELNGLCQLR